MDQIDVRMKALHITKKLFALPRHQIAQKYRAFFSEFLNRFLDISNEVRLFVISCAKVFYMNNPSGAEALEVLSKFIRTFIFALTEHMILLSKILSKRVDVFKIHKLSRCPRESTLRF